MPCSANRNHRRQRQREPNRTASLPPQVDWIFITQVIWYSISPSRNIITLCAKGFHSSFEFYQWKLPPFIRNLWNEPQKYFFLTFCLSADWFGSFRRSVVRLLMWLFISQGHSSKVSRVLQKWIGPIALETVSAEYEKWLRFSPKQDPVSFRTLPALKSFTRKRQFFSLLFLAKRCGRPLSAGKLQQIQPSASTDSRTEKTANYHREPMAITAREKWFFSEFWKMNEHSGLTSGNAGTHGNEGWHSCVGVGRHGMTIKKRWHETGHVCEAWCSKRSY